jgi:putative membrane protein
MSNRRFERMGPNYFWMHGMWGFPGLVPILVLVVLVAAAFMLFGRGGGRSVVQGRGYDREDLPRSESALDILKQRYAKGEITREDFEQMKKDIET